MTEINFEKYADGLVPVVVQDAETRVVLMLGFMNREALEVTKKTGKATFYSRSRQKLWTKGETSGNFLIVKDVLIDCDADTILLKVQPVGKVCHTGADTCFNEQNLVSETSEQDSTSNLDKQSSSEISDFNEKNTAETSDERGFADSEKFLFELEKIIKSRKGADPDVSYTAKLFSKGIDKIAQKLGEEAVELVIEAKNQDAKSFKAEAADLLYHFLVLLAAKEIQLSEILEVLKSRMKPS